jgi:TPR repeat protein
MYFGVAAAILFFGLTANGPAANAGSWEDATAAFARKEYAAALKLMQPLAEKGNALAQYRIATMHRMGLGVSKDAAEAKKWSRLAARQGNADAQALLGSLYYKAEGGGRPTSFAPICGMMYRRSRAAPRPRPRSRRSPRT